MSRSYVFAALLALGALDAAGYGVIAPVVPTIAEETGAGPAVIGALVTCFAVGQLVAYPIAGRIIQRRHATVVLWTAMALMVIGDLGFILGDSLAVYFPARFLMGLGAGGLWMGLAFATLERFPGEELRRLTALMAAYAIGGLAGPALGSIGGVRGPFAAHLALVLAGCVLVGLLGAPRGVTRFDSDRGALRRSGFWLSSAAIALVSISYGTFEGPLPLHFATELSQGEIAALFVGTSVLVGIFSALGGRMGPRVGVAAGSLGLAGGVALAGLAGVPLGWIVAAAITGVGFGLCQAGSMGILLGTVGAERMVLAMVVWSQLFAIGYIVGPVAGGIVAETLGFGAIGLVPLAALIPVAFLLLRPPTRVLTGQVPIGR